MADWGGIRLSVPADLRYRDLTVRLVASACRMVRKHQPSEEPTSRSLDLSDRFDAELVSAFSEIFNNIAIHGYAGAAAGAIDIDIRLGSDQVVVILSETGSSFDLAKVLPPELEKLPERGMGLHIARSFLDELDYQPGPPNVWRLTKYHRASGPSNQTSQA